jgi:hypothetical protein
VGWHRCFLQQVVPRPSVWFVVDILPFPNSRVPSQNLCRRPKGGTYRGTWWHWLWCDCWWSWLWSRSCLRGNQHSPTTIPSPRRNDLSCRAVILCFAGLGFRTRYPCSVGLLINKLSVNL